MRVRVSIESMVLVFVCIADMLATLYFVLNGMATEQNPLMAACMSHSPVTFVLVKMVSFVPFVIAVELYRKRNPDFARRACMTAIVLYVVTFVVFTVKTNMA